ncbi:MAG: ImmA/IrrE family metallo-endopeptidase, partial [Chloroflexota bacterium]|nr:ImmA/IrrE family metallo-endopeptidase [Chloroflexota bacterium]
VQGVSRGGQILIASGLDSRSRLLVLAHEVAHELAHQGEEGDEKPRAIRELEAESTAFVVGRILGVDNPFSADYLLNYGLDAVTLRAALATIQSLVRRVMAVIAPEQGEQEVRRAA